MLMHVHRCKVVSVLANVSCVGWQNSHRALLAGAPSGSHIASMTLPSRPRAGTGSDRLWLSLPSVSVQQAVRGSAADCLPRKFRKQLDSSPYLRWTLAEIAIRQTHAQKSQTTYTELLKLKHIALHQINIGSISTSDSSGLSHSLRCLSRVLKMSSHRSSSRLSRSSSASQPQCIG
jgi:hypothetical protein